MIGFERVQLATAESDDGFLDAPDQLNQLGRVVRREAVNCVLPF